jgi:hypothetical protein
MSMGTPTPEETVTTCFWPETFGSAGIQLLRRVQPAYADGVGDMAGQGRRSAREVSNRVHSQAIDRPNALGLTDFLWQWGQFVDHDIDLTDGSNPPESEPIAVPRGDPWFDPEGAGDVVIAFNRSLIDSLSGTGVDNPRQQVNEITAWIDASNVYGSDRVRRDALRTLDGTGQLKTSAGGQLPFNVDGHANAGGNSDNLFLAGDVRANEQIGLTAMHTLFVREHNRLAAALLEEHPDWPGDRIFEESRRHVAALMQVITYREFLPALLGDDALPPYQGYRPEVDASIANVFSTAGYRIGHSLLSPLLLRVDGSGAEAPEGHISLADAFFAPAELVDNDIDSVLRGLASQRCQNLDVYVIDEVRNFLFGPPGAGGFDLAALNIQRGRDHGLPGYNDVRQAYGLPRLRRFDQVSLDPEVQRRLASAYGTPNQMDVWVGGLAEDHIAGTMVGPLMTRIVADQFRRLRDGDRFWYQNQFEGEALERLERTRLADVIRRNTSIRRELADDVFRIR